MIENYILSGFFLLLFLARGHAFLANAVFSFTTVHVVGLYSTVHVTFLFPTVHAMCLCSTVPFNPLRFPICTSLAKKGLILSTTRVSGQQPPVTPLPVYVTHETKKPDQIFKPLDKFPRDTITNYNIYFW